MNTAAINTAAMNADAINIGNTGAMNIGANTIMNPTIGQTIEPRKLNLTKIIELLSSCGHIQDVMINSLIKNHEKGRVACGKYFYEVYIYLKKQGDVFKYDGASFNFLRDSDYDTATMDAVISAFNKMGGINSETGMYAEDIYAASFLALINLYSRQPYKYIYISVIIDYGMNSGLTHQTALIVDVQRGQFLYYEPYGKYEKYGARYSGAILEFLQQYRFPDKYYTGGQVGNRGQGGNLGLGSNGNNDGSRSNRGTLKYDTWHNYFGLPNGIQTILMHAHNATRDQFETEKNALMDELKRRSLPNYNKLTAKLYADKDHPAHKDDYTFDTLKIMGYFVDTPITVNEEADRHYLEHKALELYFKYNSKTCVTITLVEMNYFFTYLHNLTRQEQSAELSKYYAEYGKYKNHKLVGELDKFIHTALNYNKVHNWASNPIGEMCDLVYK
jgi:hypothetical protein